MKIFFLCPSNTKFMPYLTYYESCVKKPISYVVWDRFCSEEKSDNKFIFQDGLIRHQRGFFNYIKYLFFLYKVILNNKNDGFVIFGAQLCFFLMPYLLFTKKKYVIDIRDYHGLMRFIPNKIFSKASFVAVSSPAYIDLFNSNVKAIVSHNVYNYGDVDVVSLPLDKSINISYMGAIRDIDSQKILIDGFLKNKDFTISFHGDGDIVSQLKAYVQSIGANNVIFTGRYEKSDEAGFYQASALINMIRDNNSYNERVALPNRLYSAAIFYRPCLCFGGTLLADYVKKYSLGLCLTRDKPIDIQVLKYFESFCFEKFKRDCDVFIDSVNEDNKLFNSELSDFFDA